MSGSEDQSNIWFERLPGFAIKRAYMPVTMRGFYILLAFLLGPCIWILPFALLAQFNMISGPWAFGCTLPVIPIAIMWFDRIASRHSAPRR
jgi:hypothetical protein